MAGIIDYKKIELTQEQKDVVNDESKKLLIKGGAGAGKTLVLITRALKLKKENPKSSVIILTFTNSAANYLKKLVGQVCDSVQELDRMGTWYNSDDTIYVANVDSILTSFNLEFKGNDGSINRTSIIYEKNKEEINKLWQSIKDYWTNNLEGLEKYKFDHVLVDEVTDLDEWQIDMLELISKASNDNSDDNATTITLAMDEVQSIYKKNAVRFLKGYTEKKLPRSYRSTIEIMAFAVRVLGETTDDYKKVVDDIKPSELEKSGLKPLIRRFQNDEEELEHVIEEIKEHQDDEDNVSSGRTLAIICNTNKQIVAIKEKLGNYNNELITLTTIHSAKGLEFDDVIVPFCNNAYGNVNYGGYYNYQDNKRKLYVAMTRAKESLVVTCTSNCIYAGIKNIPDNLYE